MRTITIILALVALVAAACGGTAPSPSTTTAAPSPANLSSGPYARPDLLPGVTVELDDGWSSGTVGDGSISLRREVTGGEAVLTLAGVDAESATDAATAIQALPGLEVLASTESRIGGLTGPNLELENTSTTPVDALSTPSGAVALEPGHRMWLSMFDTEDGVRAVAVIADAAAWDAALLAAEPVLETVAFGG